MAPHSSSLAWRIPWTEELCRLQSMGLRRVRLDWVTKHTHTHTHEWIILTWRTGSWPPPRGFNPCSSGFNPWVGKIPWRREWQYTPVFLPGESPWTEELGGLQSMWSQRVRHDWSTKHSTSPFMDTHLSIVHIRDMCSVSMGLKIKYSLLVLGMISIDGN